MKPDILSAFSIRRCGTFGQEILNADGDIIAWTTDAWVAQVICSLLNENEDLLTQSKTARKCENA